MDLNEENQDIDHLKERERDEKEKEEREEEEDETENETENEDKKLINLPADIVFKISQFLDTQDYLSLRSVDVASSQDLKIEDLMAKRARHKIESICKILGGVNLLPFNFYTGKKGEFSSLSNSIQELARRLNLHQDGLYYKNKNIFAYPKNVQLYIYELTSKNYSELFVKNYIHDMSNYPSIEKYVDNLYIIYYLRTVLIISFNEKTYDIERVEFEDLIKSININTGRVELINEKGYKLLLKEERELYKQKYIYKIKVSVSKKIATVVSNNGSQQENIYVYIDEKTGALVNLSYISLINFSKKHQEFFDGIKKIKLTPKNLGQKILLISDLRQDVDGSIKKFISLN